MLQLRQIHVPPCRSTRKGKYIVRQHVSASRRIIPRSLSEHIDGVAISGYDTQHFPDSYTHLSADNEETYYPDEDVLEVRHLRDRLVPRPSPYINTNNMGGGFVGDRDKIRLHTVEFESSDSAGAFCSDGMATVGDEDTCILLPEWAIRCGPRRTIFYNPQEVSAAVVTCGGLCPGLNDVVQNVVYTLLDYGVPPDNILGIRFGLRGFYSREHKPIQLTAQNVDGIHLTGGTVLGTSRGGATVKEIVSRISLWGLNMVFVVGGNGGNAAAHAIAEECESQQVNCSVIGIPKSIDNDILLIDRCFGFETAVEEAQRALMAAKVEARSAHNGLGLVKLMGRQSGFIAMQASMAAGVVDVCLIPEIPFSLRALTRHVRRIMARQGHCVVCAAEGAGQDILAKLNEAAEKSGNGFFTHAQELKAAISAGGEERRDVALQNKGDGGGDGSYNSNSNNSKSSTPNEAVHNTGNDASAAVVSSSSSSSSSSSLSLPSSSTSSSNWITSVTNVLSGALSSGWSDLSWAFNSWGSSTVAGVNGDSAKCGTVEGSGAYKIQGFGGSFQGKQVLDFWVRQNNNVDPDFSVYLSSSINGECRTLNLKSLSYVQIKSGWLEYQIQLNTFDWRSNSGSGTFNGCSSTISDWDVNTIVFQNNWGGSQYFCISDIKIY